MRKTLIVVMLLILILSSVSYGDEIAESTESILAVPIKLEEGKVYITSLFGYRLHPVTGNRQFHTGVDISAPKDTFVYAISNGVVTFAENNGSAGNEIRIYHGNGVYSKYLHMSKRAVRVGDLVEKGQVIGTVGSSGMSTASHLHFELRINDKSVNPIGIILGKI